MPFTGDRKAPIGKAAKWKISVSIGDETFNLSIPTASAASADELKQAVAAACIDKIGDELTPRSWLAGHYATMIIEYLDSQVRPRSLDGRFARARAFPFPLSR